MGKQNRGSKTSLVIAKQYRVFNFLKENKNNWHTRKDLVEELQIHWETLQFILNFFEKMNIIETKKLTNVRSYANMCKYYSINDKYLILQDFLNYKND